MNDTGNAPSAQAEGPEVHTVRLVEREGALGRLREAVKRVDLDNPAPQDIARLRTLLRAEPALGRYLFDVAQMNTERMIAALAPASSLGREAVGAIVDTMRDGLGGKDAPEIERGLIENIVTCWLRLQDVEAKYTFAMAKSQELPVAYWWERRLTAAQGRYLRAVEGLARVRRLTRPGAVQFNLGERQINVAGVVVGDVTKSDHS